MKINLIGRSLLLLAAVGGLTPGPVAADRGGRQAQDAGADAAAEQARQRTGGRVLNVQDQNAPDKGGYKVRVLTPDGRVRNVEVDAPKKDK